MLDIDEIAAIRDDRERKKKKQQKQGITHNFSK